MLRRLLGPKLIRPVAGGKSFSWTCGLRGFTSSSPSTTSSPSSSDGSEAAAASAQKFRLRVTCRGESSVTRISLVDYRQGVVMGRSGGLQEDQRGQLQLRGIARSDLQPGLSAQEAAGGLNS